MITGCNLIMYAVALQCGGNKIQGDGHPHAPEYRSVHVAASRRTFRFKGQVIVRVLHCRSSAIAVLPAAEICEQDESGAAKASIGAMGTSSGSSGITDATDKRAAEKELESSGSQPSASFSASAAAYEASCRHVTLKLEADMQPGETRVAVPTRQCIVQAAECRRASTTVTDAGLRVHMQWLVGLLQIALGLGFVLLITQIVLKAAWDDSPWFRRREFAVLNVALAGAHHSCCR